MASTTFSSSNSRLDRKSLKSPDQFWLFLSQAFQELTQNRNVLVGLLVIFLAAGAAGVFWWNHQEAQLKEARNALFEASLSWEAEKKTQLPVTPQVDQKNPRAATEAARAFEFKKLDVDAVFPKTVAQFKAMDERFSKVRPAFEARLQLGSLYYQHGQSEKALVWFEKAMKTAPTRMDEAVAYSSMGYAQENLGQWGNAVQSYQKALNLGEAALKGDLLLALGRSYEGLQDGAKARNTYDQVITDLPNTDYAKSAEAAKSKLP